MVKRALCVGISKFHNNQVNELPGCENDAKMWSYILQEKYNFDEVTLLLSSEATSSAILESLESLVRNLQEGDVAVFTISSHGSWRWDRDENSDEEDKFDEYSVCYDFQDKYNGVIVDDHFGMIFDKAHKGSRIYCIFDTCQSGTQTRSTAKWADESPLEEIPIGLVGNWSNRFLVPDDKDLEMYEKMKKNHQSRSIKLNQEDTNRLVLSACRDNQYAIDTGKWGLFSSMLYKILSESDFSASLHQIEEDVFNQVSTTALAAGGVQEPQFYGPQFLRQQPLFT